MITLDGETLRLYPAEPRHHAYILRTWLETAQDMAGGRGLPRGLIYGGTRRIAEDCLDSVQVLVSETAPATVHAWICGEPGALFWIYVPFPLRRRGIARAMIAAVCGEEKAA